MINFINFFAKTIKYEMWEKTEKGGFTPLARHETTLCAIALRTNLRINN
jgi:hypothetical protein